MEDILVDEVEEIENAKANPEAFESLYVKYFDQIFAFIKRRVNDDDISFDVTQQVFFNALASLKKYKHKGHPFSSFLYKIALNECNQYFRDSSKVRFVSMSSETSRELTEEVEYDLSGSENELKRVLRSLDQPSLSLIELRYFEKKSFKDIALMLDISETNAKVKVHRIIRKLKTLWTNEE